MSSYSFSRADTSILSRWWWTVDHLLLAAVLSLVATGALLAMAASPAVANRIGLADSYFFVRHLALIVPALALMLATSLLSPAGVRRAALAALALSVILLVATLAIGVEIKGARRWIYLAGFSLQASEFAKPSFAVVCAWLFAERVRDDRLPGRLLATILFAMVLGLIVLQPDLGQAVVLTAVWMAQFFLAGLSLWLVGFLVVSGAGGLVAAYLFLPHVTSRIDRFLDPSSGDSYQITKSLEAFLHGGLFGRGPGEGAVKNQLPDAHSDFVFAVLGEEFGALAAIGVAVLFAVVVLRGFSRAFAERDLFVLLAVAGLLVQFGVQALINMGSTLHLLPTKGMTLPFVSYGGSSLLAMGFAIGMVLALTRRRVGDGGHA
ncbi:MAG: cell division protein FtsW [Alphaproteobacteria bacterium]|nr:cell division protein FtsW [Alphaproteobacteria bacterium]